MDIFLSTAPELGQQAGLMDTCGDFAKLLLMYKILETFLMLETAVQSFVYAELF